MKPCTLQPFQFLVPLDQIAPDGFTMQAPVVNTSNSNDLLNNSAKIELTNRRNGYIECVTKNKKCEESKERTKSVHPRKLRLQVVLNASRSQIDRLHRNYSQLFYLIIFTN